MRPLVPLLLVAATRIGAQQPAPPLPQPATDSVAAGLPVMRTWMVEDAPWPRVRVYRFIAASPERSAALFADYEYQKSYVSEDLKEARIVQRLDSARTDVYFRYASNMPFVSDITYTVREQVTHEAPATYAIRWRLLEASGLRSVEGGARFTPWRNPVTGVDGTLLVYDQFIVPSIRGAGLAPVRNRARGAVLHAVEAIANQIERETRDDVPRSDRHVVALRASLGLP